MNTQITKPEPKPVLPTKPSAINALAARMSVEPAKLYEALKETVFKKATNEELLALVVIANEFGLNPFCREIYAFPAKGGGVVPVISVDGWNKMLVNHPDFDGMEFQDNLDEAGELVSITITIYHKRRSHPTRVTEYLSECKRNTEPWNTMKFRMLRNRVICQGARVAFGFSAKHEDEIDGSITVESSIIETKQSPNEIPKKIVTSDSKVPDHAAELEAIVMGGGYSFSDLQKFCVETSQMENADSIGSFAEIPQDVAKRLIRAKAGLLAGLEKVKGAA